MNVHLVMFMTHKYGMEDYYINSVENLIESSKQFGIEHFHIYNPETLNIDQPTLQYMKDNHDTGFGFYMWKPLVILDVMEQIKDGDVVLYHDAGRPEYNFSIKKDINILVDKVIKKYEGIGLAQGGWSNNQYTKDKCFKLMGCDTEFFRSKTQIVATWGIYEKNPKSLEFLNEWKKWCLNHDVICSPIDEENHEGYVRHTWDQSILTNLFYTYSLQPLPYSVPGWEKDINSFIDNKYDNISIS